MGVWPKQGQLDSLFQDFVFWTVKQHAEKRGSQRQPGVGIMNQMARCARATFLFLNFSHCLHASSSAFTFWFNQRMFSVAYIQKTLLIVNKLHLMISPFCSKYFKHCHCLQTIIKTPCSSKERSTFRSPIPLYPTSSISSSPP